MPLEEVERASASYQKQILEVEYAKIDHKFYGLILAFVSSIELVVRC